MVPAIDWYWQLVVKREHKRGKTHANAARAQADPGAAMRTADAARPGRQSQTIAYQSNGYHVRSTVDDAG
jgi:hypothetical protein